MYFEFQIPNLNLNFVFCKHISKSFAYSYEVTTFNHLLARNRALGKTQKLHIGLLAQSHLACLANTFGIQHNKREKQTSKIKITIIISTAKQNDRMLCHIITSSVLINSDTVILMNIQCHADASGVCRCQLPSKMH